MKRSEIKIRICKCTPAHICNSHRLSESRNQIDHNHETHGETTETTHIQKYEFAQIVHGRVGPTPTLGEQDLPVIWCNSVRMSVPHELSLEVGEVLEQQGREISIFSEVQKILHMKGVDSIL